jgi:hypothetical protein
MSTPDYLNTPIGKRIIRQAEINGIERDQAYRRVKVYDRIARHGPIKSVNMMK